MLNWLADQTVTVLKLGCIISRRQIRSAQKNARRLITPFPRRKPRDLRRRKLLAIAEGIMDTTILRTYSLIAGATVSIRMLQTTMRRSAGRYISRRLTVARISQ